jgi:hypothetical protein
MKSALLLLVLLAACTKPMEDRPASDSRPVGLTIGGNVGSYVGSVR